MSKESDAVYRVFLKGSEDKRQNKKYSNPYCRNKEKSKYKAYKNGYKYL